MQKGPESKRAPAESDDFLQIVVGLRIRDARKRAKLSQKDLAKAIGSGQSYIYQVEAGTGNLTLKSLSKIAAALDTAPSNLLLAENSENVAEMLHSTMRELDLVKEQLWKVYLLLRVPHRV